MEGEKCTFTGHVFSVWLHIFLWGKFSDLNMRLYRKLKKISYTCQAVSISVFLILLYIWIYFKGTLTRVGALVLAQCNRHKREIRYSLCDIDCKERKNWRNEFKWWIILKSRGHKCVHMISMTMIWVNVANIPFLALVISAYNLL